MTMLQIKNLHAAVEGKEILRGIDLAIARGETHAIMGPNGSGKSTLARVLAGQEAYEVTAGEVLYEGKDLLAMDPEERARAGVNLMRQGERAFLVITDYQRLLNYIIPDRVHVMVDGRLVRSGGKGLALELESRGYSWLEAEAAAQPVGA